MAKANGLWTAAAIAWLAASGGCGSTNWLVDSGFDLWCDGVPCGWTLEQGTVRRVPTWHERDYGVELLSDPTVLAQPLVQNVDDTVAPPTPDVPEALPAGCFELQVNHRSGSEAALSVTIDALDDGVPEVVFDLPSAEFELESYAFEIPSFFPSPVLRIDKRLSGRATVAVVDVVYADGCGPVAEVKHRPNGAPCDGEGQCAGGSCNTDVCGSCAEGGGGCGSDVCGQAYDPDPAWAPYLACVAPGERVLGEACAVDAECGTGVCCEGRCSECCMGYACADGGSCDQRGVDAGFGLGPFMCATGPRAAGEPCLQGEDCQSGACAGATLRACSTDGRTCDTFDDCRSGTCGRVGVRDGLCE